MRYRLICLLLCWALSALRAPSADIYVASNATPAEPYTNWSGAFTNLQNALDYARTNEGETVTNIYLAGHIFQGTGVANSVFAWQDATNQNLRGGYEANPAAEDLPGARGAAWPTILRRSSGNARVLLLSNLSNCVLEQLIICNGSRATNGSGAYLAGCREIFFAACEISSNGVSSTYCPLGGGLYLSNSTATLTNCLLAGNHSIASANSEASRGGGAYVGAGSRLTVVGSSARNNYVTTSGWNGSSYGGAFAVAAGGTLEISATVISTNSTPQISAPGGTYGGAIDNRGTLLMQNCLVVSNYAAMAIYGDVLYSSGTTVVENCTFADNNTNAIVYAGGRIAISNSVFWGHAQYDLMNFPADAAGVLSNVWYCDLGGGQNEGQQGCVSIDPLFADRAYYHLQSTASNYSGGYFSGGSWTTSSLNSPLIDRGDPAADYDREPEPNGSRLNLGAYGNTETASCTPAAPADQALVTNLGAQAWGHRTALLRGEVLEDYGESPEIRFRYWEDGSGTTNSVNGGVQAGVFASAISGLTPGATYHYLVAATNRAGETNSGVATFRLHAAASALFAATNGDNTAGTNWATAHTYFQAVLNLLEEGDTLYLAGQVFEDAPGYLSSDIFTWRNATNVTLRGGWRAAAEDSTNAPGERDAEAWPTILQRASGKARVLFLTNLENCVFEQLTIRKGAIQQGSGVFLTGCRDLAFVSCEITSNGWITPCVQGGGLYLTKSTAALSNCLVATNRVYTGYQESGGGDRHGGAAYLASGSRLVVSGSCVRRNTANTTSVHGYQGYGGAFYVAAGATLELYETVISTNSMGRGNDGNCFGVIYNLGTLQMRNCLVVSNFCFSSAYGDAIYTSGNSATCTVVNCTFADNNTNAIVYAGGRIAISNSIFWGQAGCDLLNFPMDHFGRLTTVGHTLFGSAYHSSAAVAPMQGIHGCVVADPRFTNAAAGDYRLLASSPAINAGTNQPWMAGASDLDGNRRIRGRAADLGCYEAAPRPGTVWGIQ